jgi:magnesium transporter
MSDHEVIFDEPRDDTRYSTPVPELDDHRHQSASVQRTERPERSRRGTVDTLYGSAAGATMARELALVNEGLLRPNGRDFEEAIVDGESGRVSPLPPRSRRPTVASIDTRDVSPPNSVKAFAEARRRDRELSVSDPISVTGNTEAKRYEDRSLHRTMSNNSRRSYRSRRYINENDTVSLAASTPSVEEDVCFPQQTVDEKRDKRKLYIDYDYLERFIAEEERDRTPPKNQPQPRIFNDLRASNGIYEQDSADSVEAAKNLSAESLKEKLEHPVMNEKFGMHQHADPNRFSFFSSAWESTIHAPEFGDLIMPGENIRGLFTLPDDEEDGVWWLNMVNPTEEEIRSICKAFGIHPLTIEDIEKQETREKIELFPSYYFACFRSFHTLESEDGGTELDPYNVYVIVFREGTLSFSFAPNPHAAQVRKRITALKDYVTLSSDWICYALM